MIGKYKVEWINEWSSVDSKKSLPIIKPGISRQRKLWFREIGNANAQYNGDKADNG
jgi:hypothetical protein